MQSLLHYLFIINTLLLIPPPLPLSIGSAVAAAVPAGRGDCRQAGVVVAVFVPVAAGSLLPLSLSGAAGRELVQTADPIRPFERGNGFAVVHSGQGRDGDL